MISWVKESSFIQVTIVPALTVMVLGSNLNLLMIMSTSFTDAAGA